MEKQETNIPEEKFILCDCGCELLKMSMDAEEDRYIYLAIYTYGQYHPKPNLWRRLKYSFNHLRTGKIYGDQIVLTSEKAKEISEWINKNIN